MIILNEIDLEGFLAIKNLMDNTSATEGERRNARKKYEKYRNQFESGSNNSQLLLAAPKSTSKPPRQEDPKSTNKPPRQEDPKSNDSWLSRNKGKVALGIGVGTAAAYGIHKYKQNKKKKEEEARRQAEAEAKKKTSSRRFFK